jgi:hypothetical protein
MDGYKGFGSDIPAPFGPLEPLAQDNIPADALEHGFEPEAPAPDLWAADRARGWTSTILIATLALALLNAHALQSWAAALAPNWSGQAIRSLVAAWSARTEALGLDRPRAAIHDAYEGKKALTWDDLAAAPSVSRARATP